MLPTPRITQQFLCRILALTMMTVKIALWNCVSVYATAYAVSYTPVTPVMMTSAIETSLLQQSRSDSLEAVLTVMRRERPGIIDTAQVSLLGTLGLEYMTTSPVKALMYAEESRKTASTLGDKRGLARAYAILALIHNQQGNYENAVQFYLEALNIDEELDDNKQHKATTLNDLGKTYANRSNYRQAIEQYQKAREIFTLIGNKVKLAETLTNIAGLYAEQGDIANALQYYNQLIRIHQESGNRYALAISYNGIGFAYNDKEEYAKALTYFLKAAAIFEELNTGRDVLGEVVYPNIAVAYYWIGDYTHALEYVNRALAIANQTGSSTMRQNAYAILSVIYEALGNYKLALDYARRDNELKDTIFNEASNKRVANAEARYELKNKQSEIEKLTQAQQIQTLKISQQRQQLLFLAIGFLLVIVAVVALANGLRIKRRSELELQHKNVELEAANHEIAYKNQHLEDLNNEKNEFLGIVAHDLKNPILSIKLLAQLLHDTQVSDMERGRFTNTIISSSDQMSRIISNLLNVNAIERGKMSLNITPFSMSVAAYTVFEEYEARAEAKDVRLHFESHTDGDCLGDQTAVLQIMENLVSNALKYSPFGKNIWMRVIGDCDWMQNETASRLPVLTKTCIRFEVQDEGPGLTEDDKRKLFGKFMRLSARPTNGEQSTGLGLSIVHRMVSAMNGNVWCESVHGKGATFIVELPQADEEQNQDILANAIQQNSELLVT
jgi:signal transduction histidine kinase